MSRGVFFRILLAVLVLAGVAVLGVVAYNAGVAQGVAQAGVLGQPGVQPGPGMMPWMYGFGRGMGGLRPFGFGFGFLGCLFPLLFFFLIFGLFRVLFWGSWGRRGWRGEWGRGDWGHGAPPMFDEWHRRAHGEAPAPGAGQPQEPSGGQPQ